MYQNYWYHQKHPKMLNNFVNIFSTAGEITTAFNLLLGNGSRKYFGLWGIKFVDTTCMVDFRRSSCNFCFRQSATQYLHKSARAIWQWFVDINVNLMSSNPKTHRQKHRNLNFPKNFHNSLLIRLCLLLLISVKRCRFTCAPPLTSNSTLPGNDYNKNTHLCW